MEKSLEAQVRHSMGLAVIDISGEITGYAETKLDAAYDEAVSYNPVVIALNFIHVSYINSFGIGLVVGLLSKARQSHRKMAVFGLNDHYAKVFQVTRLVDFIDVYPDETSILERLR